MCNLYSEAKGQAAIRALFPAVIDSRWNEDETLVAPSGIPSFRERRDFEAFWVVSHLVV